MNNKLVKLKFHGDNWEIPTDWNLNVRSLGEAMRAVESNTKKLYSELLEKDQKNIKYCVVINGRNFHTDEDINNFTMGEIKNSELAVESDSLESIDIIPVIEGEDSEGLGIFSVVLGAILIIVGIILIAAGGSGALLIIAGIGLVAAGVFSLLSKPPAFEDFREIEQGGQTNYLFGGPQNVIGEGGPVPLGYGRLIVGSQTISAAFTVTDFDVLDTSETVRNEYSKLDYITLPPDTPADDGRTYNSATTTYLTSAGLLSYPAEVKVAVDNLVIALRADYGGGADEIWDLIKAFYPFVGGTSESHRYNLKSASYTITWAGQESHDSYGIHGNNSDFYGDTNLNPSAGVDGDEDLSVSSHIYIYNRTKDLAYGPLFSSIAGTTPWGDRLGIQNFDNTNNPTTIIGNGGLSNNYQNTFPCFGKTSQQMQMMIGRIDSTTVYRIGGRTPYESYTTANLNTAKMEAWQDESAATSPDSNMYILASSFNDGLWSTSASNFSDANLAAVSIGNAMTKIQAEAFFAAVQTFQVALGREI